MLTGSVCERVPACVFAGPMTRALPMNACLARGVASVNRERVTIEIQSVLQRMKLFISN